MLGLPTGRDAAALGAGPGSAAALPWLPKCLLPPARGKARRSSSKKNGVSCHHPLSLVSLKERLGTSDSLLLSWPHDQIQEVSRIRESEDVPEAELTLLSWEEAKLIKHPTQT